MINNTNINFTSRLYYGDIKGNKKRWGNIAESFNENTKYNRYEQRLNSCYEFHIYHDEKDRLTIQATNAADKFVPRECVLSSEGEKNLLKLPDFKIVEKLELRDFRSRTLPRPLIRRPRAGTFLRQPGA